MTLYNISLIHIQNLQAAAEESGNDIIYVGSPSRSEPVRLSFDKDCKNLIISFIDYPDDKDESISIDDYRYILSCFSLS